MAHRVGGRARSGGSSSERVDPCTPSSAGGEARREKEQPSHENRILKEAEASAAPGRVWSCVRPKDQNARGEQVMRGFTGIFVALSVAALVSAPVLAQSVKKGTLSGTIVTHGVTIPAGGSMTVVTAPADGEGVFVVTQVCSSAQSVSLSGSVIGPLAVPGGACQSFTPGLALLPSEVLTCTNPSGGSQECMVTGLYSKK